MVRLTVEFDPATNRVSIDGPLEQCPCLCLVALQAAMDGLKMTRAKAELAGTGGIIKANGAALNRLPPIKGG